MGERGKVPKNKRKRFFFCNNFLPQKWKVHVKHDTGWDWRVAGSDDFRFVLQWIVTGFYCYFLFYFLSFHFPLCFLSFLFYSLSIIIGRFFCSFPFNDFFHKNNVTNFFTSVSNNHKTTTMSYRTIICLVTISFSAVFVQAQIPFEVRSGIFPENFFNVIFH